MIVVETKTAKQTQKAAQLLAQEMQKSGEKGMRIIALEGELGSGKTTFAQGFAAALGVKEKILSPTFVLMKIYELRQETGNKRQGFKRLAHIDCYRLDSPADLRYLGFGDLLKDKDAIILIEWADRIRRLIPRGALRVKFRHGERPHERLLQFLNPVIQLGLSRQRRDTKRILPKLIYGVNPKP